MRRVRLRIPNVQHGERPANIGWTSTGIKRTFASCRAYRALWWPPVDPGSQTGDSCEAALRSPSNGITGVLKRSHLVDHARLELEDDYSKSYDGLTPHHHLEVRCSKEY